MLDLMSRKNNESVVSYPFDEFIKGFFNDDFFTKGFGDNSVSKDVFNAEVKENENGYSLVANLPGLTKDDVNIEYKDNYLVVSAKKNDVKEDKKDNIYNKTVHSEEYCRSYYVGEIDRNEIKAKFEDGVLTVDFPKGKEIANENRIEIK